MPDATPRLARLSAATAALAAAAWALVGRGLVNYDTLYALVWGRDLAHGRKPDFDVALAPTPHPLGTALGALLSPLSSAADHGVHGRAATTVVIVLAFLALGALGVLVQRLGAAWFDPWAGVLAALIVLTRRPVLDFGARAYVDIPYVACVLAALLVETRRPRAGLPVLALLGIAGLIRPEAWLFAVAYVGFLVWAGEREPWRVGTLVLAAVAAPVLWLLSDWVVAGDALHSLTGTRDTARELGRVTGIAHVPTTAPRRIGEILREPVLFGALGGLVFCWLWLRERVRLALAAGIVALLAFTVLAAAGLPILGRYLLLPSIIGALLCGAGVFGWRALPRGDRRRSPWMAFGTITVLLLLAFTPSQVDRIRALRSALTRQEQIQSDLQHLVRVPPGIVTRGCTPIGVPNHRPVPLLALWLNSRPQAIISAQDGRRQRLGTYLQPATPAVARDYILDPRDRTQAAPAVPQGFSQVAGNRSWLVYKRCAPAVLIHGGE